MIRYIYKITNNSNHKIYIGQHSTENVDDGYMGSGKRIKLAINKYGIENFSKEIIAYVDGTKKELDEAEKFFIKYYRNKVGAENCYNITDGGEGGSTMKGVKMSAESREKLSKAHKGQKSSFKGKHHTEESREKMSKAHKGQKSPMTGKHHTEESKMKVSIAHKRENLSQETREKMSKAHKGQKSPMTGKHHTEESKRKMSEHKIGLESPFKGKHHTEESKRKFSISKTGEKNPLFGKQHSEDTKHAMKEHYKRVKEEYNNAKSKGFAGTWNEFQQMYKNNIKQLK